MSGSSSVSSGDSPVLIPASALRTLKASELKDLCLARGLSEKGTKDDLKKRLKKDTRDHGNSSVKLLDLSLKQLRFEARLRGLSNYSGKRKDELVDMLAFELGIDIDDERDSSETESSSEHKDPDIRHARRPPTPSPQTRKKKKGRDSAASSAARQRGAPARDSKAISKAAKKRADSQFRKVKQIVCGFKSVAKVSQATQPLEDALHNVSESVVDLYKHMTSHFEPIQPLSEDDDEDERMDSAAAGSSSSRSSKRGQRGRAEGKRLVRMPAEMPGRLDEMASKLDDLRRGIHLIQSILRHPPRTVYAVVPKVWDFKAAGQRVKKLREWDEKTQDMRMPPELPAELQGPHGPIVFVSEKQKRAESEARKKRIVDRFGPCEVIAMLTQTRQIQVDQIDYLFPPDLQD